MDKEKLDKAFQEAAQKASASKTPLPPDILLLLYAYYNQGNQKKKHLPFTNIKENDLRTAFKYNAMMQVNSLSSSEAKKEYIRLVKKYIKD